MLENGSRKLWGSDVVTFPTLKDAVGHTPLVALQRIGASDNQQRGNVILGKLEGNNPAGSVKDRAALSMIKRAEERGEIKPGDTLIEATAGNTGSRWGAGHLLIGTVDFALLGNLLIGSIPGVLARALARRTCLKWCCAARSPPSCC
jgi:hypothetical protein